MIILIDGDVGEEMMIQLISTYNALVEDEKLLIYFSSGGGCMHSASVIIDLINQNKDITEVIAFDMIGSAAFRIFYSINCERRILPDTNGMYHHATTTMMLRENSKPRKNSHEEFCLNNMTDFVSKVHESVNFNKKELTLIQDGENAYFGYDRLVQMLKFNKK